MWMEVVTTYFKVQIPVLGWRHQVNYK